MKKIFLFIVILFGLFTFNNSNAAMCPSGYTEINVVNPTLTTNKDLHIYMYNNRAEGIKGDINNIAHYYTLKTGWICYKHLGTISNSNYYRYSYDNSRNIWYYGSVSYTPTVFDRYEFIEANFIPEIGDLSIIGGDFSSYGINISSVVDTSTSQSLSIYYSWDGNNYTKSSSTINTPINNGTGSFIVNATGKTISNNLLYVKVNDGKIDSNVKTINVYTGEIFIDNSGLNTYNKLLKATSNGGELFYSFTQNDICDNSLQFESYTDLNLTDISLNGKKACYKSILNGVENFKLSNLIEGIYVGKTTPVKKSNLFDNYLKWKKGELKDFDPLYILITSQVSSSVQGTSSISKNYPKLLTDVNGDGLPDLIITNYIYALIGSTPGSTIGIWESQYYYALLLNKGNMDFEVKYRCVNIGTNFYGDCVE